MNNSTIGSSAYGRSWRKTSFNFVSILTPRSRLFYYDKTILLLCNFIVFSFDKAGMAYKWILAFMSCLMLCFCSFGAEKKGRYFHSLSDEAYETLLLLVQGNFNVPVAERTREQRNAVVRYWRQRDSLHLGPQSTPTLYFDGKKVVKKSSIASLVAKTFDQAKAGGCKKLRNRAADGFAGLSERNILRVTNNEAKYRIHNVKFTNKATPRPVTARTIQGQHQIDLMDLSKEAVNHNRHVYKYVLSVMDIFSRYLWLRPLEKKSSQHVSRALQRIYSEHGPPDRLQSDRGTEFEGKVRPLCKQLKIKLIKSRPYHPQSQGKIERSHRRLRKKIMYDLVSLGKKGVNWAANLEDYNRILNEECKEELGWRSPFEIYYGRKSNQLVKASLDCVDSDDNMVTTAPNKRELACHLKKVKKIRRRAKLYSKKLNDRMVKSHKRRHKAETFKVKEHVLVRYRPQKGGKLAPKRRFVVKGTVVKKRKTNPDTYKVRFRPPNSSKHIEEWFSVEDIASIRKRHRGSTAENKTIKQQKIKQLRKKMYIPLTARDRFLDLDFPDMDLSLMYNPPGDGNCQFGALCFWLNRLGIHRSAETVREEIIKYLTNNPNNSEGMPLELFAATPWAEYLHSMAKNGTYGDQITLQAAADLYNIEIVVISTLGPDATAVISPSSSIPTARVQLGHYAENHGEHYICVDGRVLLEEEEQEERAEEEVEDDGADLLSTQEDYAHGQYMGKEREVPEQDQHRIQIPIHFVGNETVEMVSTNDATTPIERLPNEILEKILSEALLSSGFSWPNHVCRMYNNLCKVNVRFRDITRRLVSMLPSIYFSEGGELGIVSVRSLIKKFGSSSGVVLEVRRIVASPNWANAWLDLRFRGLGWFIILNIFWRKSQK